ncbi:MAG: ABC transporter permease [Planctomycetes bacterium]|nr:ABC transporter permease [Planctomycetota bacterium]
MNTTPPQTSPPASPVLAPIPLGPQAETAPSAMVIEGPTFARMVGFAGLVLFVLGAAAVISTSVLGPRMVSEGLGFMFAAAGLALMLYHATTDGEQEIRRMYGGFALFWILFSVVVSFLPGPTDAAAKTVGYFLLPWGLATGMTGLLFTIPFCLHETDDVYRNAALTLLLAVGGILSVGAVTAGIMKPDFLTGHGLTLALLGLAFVCAYLGQVDVSDGVGFTVAFSLGAFGAGVIVFAIARAAFPTLLFEGPTMLRTAKGELDTWRVLFRLLGGVAFALPAILAFTNRSPLWLKIATGAFGLLGGGVVLVSLFANPVLTTPRPFLVPNGLILMAIGLLYLCVALGVCSDNQFVTLTRRELASYFLSPIGYLVLVGMAAIQWLVYESFIGTLQRYGQREISIPEPIVAHYFGLLPGIILLLVVPALTMRLVSEEKRTGSLELLLTAPVNEWPIILSKFLATWIFFLVCWLPSVFYLMALRLEVPVPFDYRPLLSFYICLAAQGLAFIGMGLFFSTLTRNQIVAAVMTAVGMMLLLLTYLIRVDQMTLGMPQVWRSAIGRFSFLHMWEESLAGRLPLRDTMLFASLGLFWLFLSVKVLEIRKWS